MRLFVCFVSKTVFGQNFGVFLFPRGYDYLNMRQLDFRNIAKNDPLEAARATAKGAIRRTSGRRLTFFRYGSKWQESSSKIDTHQVEPVGRFFTVKINLFSSNGIFEQSLCFRTPIPHLGIEQAIHR